MLMPLHTYYQGLTLGSLFSNPCVSYEPSHTAVLKVRQAIGILEFTRDQMLRNAHLLTPNQRAIFLNTLLEVEILISRLTNTITLIQNLSTDMSYNNLQQVENSIYYILRAAGFVIVILEGKRIGSIQSSIEVGDTSVNYEGSVDEDDNESDDFLSSVDENDNDIDLL